MVFAFVSPRGNGLKVGVAATGIADAESYKHAWSVVMGHMQTRYPAVHINVDEHVKYLHALCYMSLDPALYINPAAPLDIPAPAPKSPGLRRARTIAPTMPSSCRPSSPFQPRCHV